MASSSSSEEKKLAVPISSDPEKKKKLILISSDEEKFEVSEASAVLSVTIKTILEDDDGDREEGIRIPLSNVDSKTLAKVIEFCNRHAAGDTNPDETLKQFDADFVKSRGFKDLSDLLLAANYLNIDVLLKLISGTIAQRIKNFPVEKIRELFNVENDFTEEEEKAIQDEHPWVYENLDKDS